ncbi:MAG: hypothetical protein UR98_C0001G0101 [Parcubacteria group bacterium GW2011_GWA1_36_12]|nr:MAG: hypothetical protein UR98_C0001G0101 [Parcubacteria group bacterium GW2011_GWA1_36_12]
MRKLYSLKFLTAPILIFAFFLPHLLSAKIPMPADALLGLYHPWRDQPNGGYDAYRFPTKNPLITDSILQIYPWRKLVVENIKNGSLPLWNPYSFAGQPLLANIQSATLQFLNFLFFILPFNLAWVVQIILPPLLTALFMYFFLRNIKLTYSASVFGAFVLPLSGYFMSWFTWGNMISTAMWLPLILLSVNKLFSKVSASWFLILIFASFQTIVSGFWQAAFYVFVASFAYLVFLSVYEKKIKPLLSILAAFFLGLLISASQILPSLEFILLSARSTDRAYFVTRQDWFLPLQNLVQLIAPDYFGNPTTYNYWGIWNYLEFVSFIGIIPLFLAIVVLTKLGKSSRFFLALALFSLLLSIANPISKIPYLINLPLISSMQPSRAVMLLDFSLVCLAAFGFERFLRAKSKRKVLIPLFALFAVFASIAVFTLFFHGSNSLEQNRSIALHNLFIPTAVFIALSLTVAAKLLNLSKKLILVLIFSLTLAELFRFGYKFTPFSKYSSIFPSTGIIDYLASQSKPFRIISTDRRIFHPNTSSVYKIEMLSGYDPLFLKDYAKLVSSYEAQRVTESGSFNRIINPQNFNSGLINFLNVQYLLTFDEIQNPSFEKVFQEGETKVYNNKNVIQRLYFVNEVVKVNSKDEELQSIVSTDFDFKNKAVATCCEFIAKKQNPLIFVDKYTDQEIKITTETESIAPLVSSTVFYPGWQAYIDGKNIPINRVNYMFQSIIVPQGKHEVVFKYRPNSFFLGAKISIMAALISLFLGSILWIKKYR